MTPAQGVTAEDLMGFLLEACPTCPNEVGYMGEEELVGICELATDLVRTVKRDGGIMLVLPGGGDRG